MGNYNTTTEAIIDLQERGYDQDFTLKGDQLLYVQQSELIKAEEFEIAETYQFADEQSNAGNRVIYGLRAINLNVKGILMTSRSKAIKLTPAL